MWPGMKFIFLFLSLFAMFSMLEKANGSNVILSWNPSVSPNVAGYDVYYGTTSGNYPYKVNAGDATTITISNLTPGAKYYFAATAYAADGKQSSFSAPTTVLIPQLVASATQPVAAASPNGGAVSRQGLNLGGRPAATVAGILDAVGAAAEADPAGRAAAAIAAAPDPEPSLAPVVNLTMAEMPDAPALASVQFPTEPGHWYEVQATTDFQNWISVWQSDMAISNGWASFTDSDSKSYSSRFYRLVSH
jgi:hypothetical protein